MNFQNEEESVYSKYDQLTQETTSISDSKLDRIVDQLNIEREERKNIQAEIQRLKEINLKLEKEASKID